MKNVGVNARNSNGQFLTGHPGGPGRPSRETEAKYLKALSKSVSLKDWRAVVKQALLDAKAGDRHARRWLSDFLLGRPADVSEILNAAAEPSEPPKVVLLDWRRKNDPNSIHYGGEDHAPNN